MPLRRLWARLSAPRPESARAPAPPGEAERLLRRLDFTVVRQLDGLRQGEHRNSAYGPGLDLAELRAYQPGDDVRALDWNVTARMAEPFVRRYHEDREISAWLVLDFTGSTDFGSEQQTKRDRLIDVAGTLARLLTSRGDRVGALLYTGSVLARGSGRRRERGARGSRRPLGWGALREAEPGRLPAELVAAGQGRTHTLQLLQRALSAARRVPASGTVLPAQRTAGTDLAALLEQAFRTARQRSLVIVLSDLLDSGNAGDTQDGRLEPVRALGRPATGSSVNGLQMAAGPAWGHALAALTRRHEVVVVWIRDPREVELPDVGVVTFEDAESGEQLVVDTSQPSVRAAYVALAAERTRAVQALLGRYGAALWMLSTADALVPALVRFLEQRQRTLLGAQRLIGRPA